MGKCIGEQKYFSRVSIELRTGSGPPILRARCVRYRSCHRIRLKFILCSNFHRPFFSSYYLLSYLGVLVAFYARRNHEVSANCLPQRRIRSGTRYGTFRTQYPTPSADSDRTRLPRGNRNHNRMLKVYFADTFIILRFKSNL